MFFSKSKVRSIKTSILSKIINKKVIFYRWQVNLLALIFFSAGSIFGLYYLGNEVILPRLFAAEPSLEQSTWISGTSPGTIPLF